MEEAENIIKTHYRQIENKIYNTEVSPDLLAKYTDWLKSGCAPGNDGVTAEQPVFKQIF